MPDLIPDPMPLPGANKNPLGLPRATRKRGKCNYCGAPLKRFVEQKKGGSPMEVEEKGLRCKKCKAWYQRVGVYDHEVHEEISDPRRDPTQPVIGEK